MLELILSDESDTLKMGAAIMHAINRIESELSLFRDEVVDPESDSVLHTAHIIVASLLEDMNREIDDIGGYPE